jgi:hypothetical protein
LLPTPEGLFDGWLGSSSFLYKYRKIKAQKEQHKNFSSEFNSDRYTKLRAIEGSSAQPLCYDAAPHRNKLKLKTYLSKAFSCLCIFAALMSTYTKI